MATSWQVQVLRDRLQPDVDDLLLVDALVLHLEEEVVRAEDVAIRGRRVERLPLLLGADAGRDLTLEAAAQPDQALRVLRQQLLVDARLVVEALGVARRHQLDQVVVALVGLGQQHQVVGGLARRAALRPPVPGRDVDLAAEDRIDPALARLVVEHDRREHVAVLGDRRRRHLQLDALVEQLLDPAGAVEQREFGVQVEMDEFRHCECRTRGVQIDGLSIGDCGSSGWFAAIEANPIRRNPQSAIR